MGQEKTKVQWDKGKYLEVQWKTAVWWGNGRLMCGNENYRDVREDYNGVTQTTARWVSL